MMDANNCFVKCSARQLDNVANWRLHIPQFVNELSFDRQTGLSINNPFPSYALTLVCQVAAGQLKLRFLC